MPLVDDMKCPACNADGAYIGIVLIRCPNRRCKYFDKLIKKPSKPKVKLQSDLNKNDSDLEDTVEMDMDEFLGLD